VKFVVSALALLYIILLVLASGCADISVKQKVGNFGTAFGTSSEEEKAIEWFSTTYGNPLTNNDQPSRFVEPLITTGLDENTLPRDKVTTFPISNDSVHFFVIYDNFRKGDPIIVSWVYLENGREVTRIKKQAGGDFGRFIVEFQKPDSGWGRGNQMITVSGNGVSSSVNFNIDDALRTSVLPYKLSGSINPAAQVNPDFDNFSDEQKTLDWFKATYGDPFTNDEQAPRFIEPLITSGLDKDNMPVDVLTTYPMNRESVYYFVIFDNFLEGDPITVNWTYLENGREVTHVEDRAGGDFGRFIIEFQKPDSGWGTGKQKITVSGRGVSADVMFSIENSVEMISLPHNPSANKTSFSSATISSRPSMVPITRTTDPWSAPTFIAEGNEVNMSSVVIKKENITAI